MCCPEIEIDDHLHWLDYHEREAVKMIAQHRCPDCGGRLIEHEDTLACDCGFSIMQTDNSICNDDSDIPF